MIIITFICMWEVVVCYDTLMEVRGKIAGACSLLPPCALGSDLGGRHLHPLTHLAGSASKQV